MGFVSLFSLAAFSCSVRWNRPLMMIEFSTSPIIAESLGSFENGRVAYDVAGKSHDLYLELTLAER